MPQKSLIDICVLVGIHALFNSNTENISFTPCPKTEIMGYLIYSFMVQRNLEGQGFLIIEISRSQNITLDSTPLEVRSDRRRDIYLTTNNNKKRETAMSVAAIETAGPLSDRPQYHALHRAANGIVKTK
jgi:hypothetical protein